MVRGSGNHDVAEMFGNRLKCVDLAAKLPQRPTEYLIDVAVVNVRGVTALRKHSWRMTAQNGRAVRLPAATHMQDIKRRAYDEGVPVDARRPVLAFVLEETGGQGPDAERFMRDVTRYAVDEVGMSPDAVHARVAALRQWYSRCIAAATLNGQALRSQHLGNEQRRARGNGVGLQGVGADRVVGGGQLIPGPDVVN